ncbi:MAG: hypothetical protein WCI27_05030 [Candidatus Omnitrophota bacterium]
MLVGLQNAGSQRKPWLGIGKNYFHEMKYYDSIVVLNEHTNYKSCR